MKRQSGAALLIALIVVVLAITAGLLSAYNGRNSVAERDKITDAALAKAKDGLIAYASTPSNINSTGYFPLPDFGKPDTAEEGNSVSSPSGNNKDFSLLGKLPWKGIGTEPLKDSSGECLWYVVSGRFKKTPKTDSLNWDTQGQIDLIDQDGFVIRQNLAAIVVAPSLPVDGQTHILADPDYRMCGGNYTPKNYLDPFDISNALFGQTNYFPNGTISSDTTNKQFVVARNATHFNDKIIVISADDIFRSIIWRSDFKNMISALLDDPDFMAHLETITPGDAISDPKGTNNVDCSTIVNVDTKAFCKNWKEMLLLKKMPANKSIVIDGAASPLCQYVLFFGGSKTNTQSRMSLSDKNSVTNYLEGINATSFVETNIALINIAGKATFDPSAPSTDLVRCLP